MANWDSYTQKATPEDADTLMIKDTAGAANKRTPFSGVWNWMVNKLTSAIISQLETTNKSIVPAINELNSNSNYIPNIPMITSIPSGQILSEYVTNNYPSKSSIYFLGISSAITEEQKSPFAGTGGFIILYNSSTTGYSVMYAFSYQNKIQNLQRKNGVWDSNWNNV